MKQKLRNMIILSLQPEFIKKLLNSIIRNEFKTVKGKFNFGLVSLCIIIILLVAVFITPLYPLVVLIPLILLINFSLCKNI